MKKTLAIILIMLLACTGLAEGTGFVFLGGITWGMSLNEVLAAAGNPEHDTYDAGAMSGLEIDDATYAGAECDIMFNFLDDRLIMCGYEYDAEDIRIDALAEAISAEYGPESEMDVANVVEIYNLMFGEGRMNEEFLTARETRYWALEDGTVILIIAYSADTLDVAFMDGTGLRASQNLDEPAPELVPEGA